MMIQETDIPALARIDPNVFIEYVLDVEQGDVHKDFQAHLDAHDNCYGELHRGMGKTTQMEGRVCFEIGRNPNIRIKYVQQSDPEAAKTGEAIMEILESDAFQDVFPEIRKGGTWGKQALTVQRDMISRDPTIEFKGINGRAGGRFDLLVGDDICDVVNAIQKPAERAKVKTAWKNNWAAMADITKGTPRVWKVGTPYHVNDITAEWRAFHVEHGGLMRVPVVGFRSPWDAFPEEYLREWRAEHGPIAYARAYELSPVSSEVLVWPAEWLDRSMVESLPDTRGQYVMGIDWAFSEKKMNDGDDPDYSIALVAKKDDFGHLYPCDMIRERVTYPEFRRAALNLGSSYQVSTCWAEGNGPQKGLVDDFARMADFPVIGVNRTVDKHTRAARNQAFVESGRLHLLANVGETGILSPIRKLQPLYDEMTTFPAGDHDDTIDAVMDLMENTLEPGRKLPEEDREGPVASRRMDGRGVFGMNRSRGRATARRF